MMSYRGPDDSGLFEDGEVRLGHRRLSILDTSSAGHQPMETRACKGLFEQPPARENIPDLAFKLADALGMAHSLEVRVPYLDKDIINLAVCIPGNMMRRRRVEKYILRRPVAPLLPSAIVWRRKRGLQLRLNKGVIETLDYLCDRLLRPADVIISRGFFAPELVEKLRRGRPARFATEMGHKRWTYRVAAVIMCDLWARIFLDRPISFTPPTQFG